MSDDRCIGVFDSGIGGLTVVRELQRQLPGESIVYFGDTARVPYGIKSTQTVTRYSREICEFLLRFNPKMIVVACNTASAVALPELESLLPIPVLGVVDPGAREAVRAANGRTIAVVHDYLEPVLKVGPSVIVLGCTHYPLLREAIAAAAGPNVTLVDSGDQTARSVVERLTAKGALSSRKESGALTCYVSDNPQRFIQLGQRFCGHPIVDVTWVPHEQLVLHEVASPA
jgi:glutamate racemase